MGIIQTLTEGGQIWTHRFRMFRQIIKMSLGISMSIGLFVTLCLMLATPSIYYVGTWYFLKAYVMDGRSTHIEVNHEFWESAARERHSQEAIPIATKRAIQITKPYATLLGESTLRALKIASLFSNVSLLCILLFFLIRGRISKSKKHISGRKLTSPWLLKWRLWLTRKASSIKIGPVPLIKGTETQHLLITGGTGTGKTNCLHHLLKQLRKKQQPALIVDTTGAFIDRYYDPNKDILLNPFDPRSATWHPWAECETQSDYASIAESFIPHSHAENENYWRLASRSLLASMLHKFSDTKKTSELVRWMLYEQLPELCKILQGTKAAAHMDLSSEKTASSIRSVASTFVECFENLEDTENPFSIREWVSQGKEDSWLFLHCTPPQRSSMRPLLSTWISCAINGLLRLHPDFNRRLWFILDELPSLQKVKDLEVLLTEGRKYGGCGVVSLQSPAQLESIYGRDSTKTIIGNTLTKIIFSEQDPEVSSRISKSFGECEIKEYHEGISYGAHEARDGVNLSTHHKNTPLISSSKIQALPKNSAYVKLPGKYPVTKIKFSLAH